MQCSAYLCSMRVDGKHIVWLRMYPNQSTKTAQFKKQLHRQIISMWIMNLFRSLSYRDGSLPIPTGKLSYLLTMISFYPINFSLVGIQSRLHPCLSNSVCMHIWYLLVCVLSYHCLNLHSFLCNLTVWPTDAQLITLSIFTTV